MKIRDHRVSVGLALLILATSAARPNAAEVERKQILAILKDRDQAYSRNDAIGASAAVAEVYTFTDEHGATRNATRLEAVNNLKRDLADVPGNHIVHRQVTTLHSLSLKGEIATMRATTIQELAGSNEAGTVVRLRYTIEFEDSWRLSQGTWTEVSVRLLKPVDRTVTAIPSPAILGMLQQMRQTSSQMRQFDESNNFSTCMSANQNQRYDYDTRKTYCSP